MRHAPPPLDGTETPRRRFSKRRKKRKKYGGGALILACRPHCAKKGAGHSFLGEGSSLHAAVWALDFGVRVKMRVSRREKNLGFQPRREVPSLCGIVSRERGKWD